MHFTSVMNSGFVDNKTALVKDDLVRTIHAGDRISVASSLFSMYAYRELREQLENIDAFRFIFTSKSFTSEKTPKEQREFYIPRLQREQGLYGTELEIKLRNELTQKAIAVECAEWIKRKGARFMSFESDAKILSFLVTDGVGGAQGDMPFEEFFDHAVGCEQACSHAVVFIVRDEAGREPGAWSAGDVRPGVGQRRVAGCDPDGA